MKEVNRWDPVRKKRKSVPKVWLSLVFGALLIWSICMLRNISCKKHFSTSLYMLQTIDFTAPIWKSKVWPSLWKGQQSHGAHHQKSQIPVHSSIQQQEGQQCLSSLLFPPCYPLSVSVNPLQFLCCTLLFPESRGTGNGWCWDSLVWKLQDFCAYHSLDSHIFLLNSSSQLAIAELRTKIST